MEEKKKKEKKIGKNKVSFKSQLESSSGVSEEDTPETLKKQPIKTKKTKKVMTPMEPVPEEEIPVKEFNINQPAEENLEEDNDRT